MKQVLTDIQNCIDELAPAAKQLQIKADQYAVGKGLVPDGSLLFTTAAEGYEAGYAAAVAGAPAGGGVPQGLLSAYCDLAASHDDALPLTATADENGLIQLHMRNGWPVEARQDFADFVAAACNVAGAGFVADMRAFAQQESPAPALLLPTRQEAGGCGWTDATRDVPDACDERGFSDDVLCWLDDNSPQFVAYYDHRAGYNCWQSYREDGLDIPVAKWQPLPTPPTDAA